MTPADAVARLRDLLERGVLDLPLPAGGSTRKRFERLASLGRDEDLSVARLAEAHCDAAAIAAEAGSALPVGALAGVWASRFGGSRVRAARRGDGWHLTGRLEFCSGVGVLDLALIDATTDAGDLQLFAVPLAGDGVRADTDRWRTAALAATGTGRACIDVELVPGAAIGAPGWYLERPGFWHGAIGVAAVWAGGALAIHDSTARRVDPGDHHAVAEVGRTFAVTDAAAAVIGAAADDIDRAPGDVGIVRALAVRHVVAAACRDVIAASARATGPGPLAFDGEHAQRVADLALYVEQQHHDADLEEIGRLVGQPDALQSADLRRGSHAC